MELRELAEKCLDAVDACAVAAADRAAGNPTEALELAQAAERFTMAISWCVKVGEDPAWQQLMGGGLTERETMGLVRMYEWSHHGSHVRELGDVEHAAFADAVDKVAPGAKFAADERAREIRARAAGA